MAFSGGNAAFYQFVAQNKQDGFLVVWGGGATNLHGTWHAP
jgi:RsiW-degrading membrane proteinase PrsW (M82 family)